MKLEPVSGSNLIGCYCYYAPPIVYLLGSLLGAGPRIGKPALNMLLLLFELIADVIPVP